MKTFAGCAFLLAIAALIGTANFATAQKEGMGMAMPKNTLLLAQLDAKQVVGGSSSSATGTGAFELDPAKHAMAYRLTYQGLEAGGAKSIVLSNFGRGKNGDVVKLLCGGAAHPCPASSSATINGEFERGDVRGLDNQLVGEFDSARVYVEIVGGNGKPEIRGQLAPNGAMVMVANYVANLAPVEGSGSKGSGTAIVSETYLPGGKVSVFYAATVAGTSGAPTHAGLVSSTAPKARTFTPRTALPKFELRSPRDEATGGSLQGLYEVNVAAPDALLARRLLSNGNGKAGIVVATTGFPDGELYGALVPVR